MMARPESPGAGVNATSPFDVEQFLLARAKACKVANYRRGQTLFSQGDKGRHVGYIQSGGVKLSVLSRAGKEAVVAMLAAGDFFGEGALAGQLIRIETATATATTRVLLVAKDAVATLLRDHPSFSDCFIQQVLKKNIRAEEDLVDQLFNSSEKRLARALLLLARYGQPNAPLTLPKVSQETLAEMVGTTRSRVNFFMNKFRNLGFIEYNGGVKIHRSLLTIVLHD
jgi:CRP-like cAMP-binding protein